MLKRVAVVLTVVCVLLVAEMLVVRDLGFLGSWVVLWLMWNIR